ncbi:hypothetical protein EWI61_00495 [Methylolobus aquaticus]|nr:hypothetical protein EWI61_00495 [Methylolobus aquaticus]
MADLPPDDAAYRRTLYTIEGDHHQLTRAMPAWLRRLQQLVWTLGIIAMMLLIVVWLYRVQTSLARLEGGISAPALANSGQEPQLSPEVKTLEGRLARVLSASVESKLRRLEQSVERGALGGEDLQLIEAAAGELRLLRSQPQGGMGHDRGATEHPRYHSVQTPATAAGKDPLGQVEELRALVYAVVVCVALLLLLAIGLWFSTSKQVRMISASPRHQLPAMRPSRENQRGT